MKTQSKNRKTLALLGAALGFVMLGMVGCMNGETGVSADVSADTESAWLTGQVTGEGVLGARTAADGEATLVTTHEVDAAGNVGPVVDSARAEANGEFRIHTRLRGEKALIVRAVRAGKEWKARFEDRLDNGSEKAVGAIDLTSSVDAEVWVELRKRGEDSAATGADIRAAVEAYADSLGLEGFQGNLEARALIVARIVLLAKARCQARKQAIVILIVRADSLRRAESHPDSGRDSARAPRPVLTPCERAAFLIAAMDPEHPDYPELRARFIASCVAPDTLPPTPEVCAEMRTRLEGLDSGSQVALGLRLRIAAYCTNGAPPPQPLTRCERAAVRLTLMDPERPSHDTLSAHFRARCLDEDPANDAAVDAEIGAAVAAGAGPASLEGGVRGAVRGGG